MMTPIESVILDLKDYIECAQQQVKSAEIDVVLAKLKLDTLKLTLGTIERKVREYERAQELEADSTH